MNKARYRTSLLSIVSVLIVMFNFSHSFSSSEDGRMHEVENGLLPYVIIEGEPSYNLHDRMIHYNVPGISITVINDYAIEWTKHYGVVDASVNNPVTDETLFSVGSLSKGVTALAVLRLGQEGKIDLYGDINNQLISWKVPENEFTRQGVITPFLLLNHSGGAMFSPSIGYLADRFPTNLQVLRGEEPCQTKAVEIDKIPGTEYQYSNAGYSILQQLIVDISGQSFPDFTREKIFQPLGMNRTTFAQPLPEELELVASAGHMGNGMPLETKRYYLPHMAAGGLWTTTSDYAKYVIELQKSNIGTSNTIISQELTHEMLSPHVSKQYGLGVFMREMYGEINYFGHLGDNRGFIAGFVSHLGDGYGAVVFTNGQNGAILIREITNGIANVYDWKAYLPEKEKVVQLKSGLAERICGRYSFGSDNSFEISSKQNDLYINQFGTVRIFHVGEGKFVTKSRLGYLQFDADSSSEKTSAIYHFSDELGRFLNEPVTCSKMNPSDKLPIELLREGFIEEAIDSYRTIKQNNPSDFYVSENRLNRLGYSFMSENTFREAIAILKLNVELYPESANCYDSLAEAYMKSGDSTTAIVHYRTSLELNPENTNAQTMLKILENPEEN